MAGYYSPSPAPPPPPEGFLPYPWVTQYDPQYQTTYYANTETGETQWTPPDPNTVSSQLPPPDAAVQGTRGMYDGASSQYGGGAYPSAQNYTSTGNAANTGTGEAASFYGSSGTTPQAPGQTSYSSQDPQQQQQYDENGQPVDGERGLGKVIVGGGLAYFAYKRYKDYQKGKLNQQQFKPPYQAPNPFNQTPQLHPPHGKYTGVHYPQAHFSPAYRDNNTPAPTPAWDQKPTPSAYGGPPPAGAYNSAGAGVQVRSSRFSAH